MKKYELMYIIRPDLESEQIKSLVANLSNIFTERGSEVLELKEIGLKELAYEIEHMKKGYYVWSLVNASNEAIAEFDRVIRITESVIRYIVVKDGE